MDFLTQIKYF
uniref:Uncharacterized protein n=1 Tax=Anguilla anguilla TaxID=7936 RepID=A0A0E9VAN4_ANGAN